MAAIKKKKGSTKKSGGRPKLKLRKSNSTKTAKKLGKKSTKNVEKSTKISAAEKPKRSFSSGKNAETPRIKTKKVSFGPVNSTPNSTPSSNNVKSILKSRKPTPKKLGLKTRRPNFSSDNSTNFSENSPNSNEKTPKFDENSSGGGVDFSNKEFRTGKKLMEKLAVLSRKDRKSYLAKLKQSKRPNYELSLKAKQIWEKIRRKKITVEEKERLTNELYALVDGKVKQMIFAHDTVRVLQCLMALKNPTVRTKLFEELKDDIVELSKSKYSKFFVVKMLKYGTPQQRMHVMKSFFGKVVDLMKHAVACDVVQYAYNEYANALQRAQLVTEFYAAEYQIFKVEELLTLKAILTSEPKKKDQILKTLADHILSISSKAAMKHSLMHRLCLDFFENCDNDNTRADIIDCIKERIPEMLHTRDGTLVSMYCVWFGTVKDRKAIVKSLKNFVTKICLEEHGHTLLPAIFDTVDDTVAVSKAILQEIKKNLSDIVANKHGVKVLHYLLNPRDPRHFNKQYVSMLSIGDSNTISKKSKQLRHEELLKEISPDLLQYASENAREMIFETNFPLLFTDIYNFCAGDKTPAFKTLCQILREEFIPCNVENMHVIEHARGHFILKHVLKNDKNLHKANQVTLSEVILQEVPEQNLQSWLSCNKGAFIITNMIESGVKHVEEKLLALIERNKRKLSRYSFSGARILLEKLNKGSTTT